MESDLLISALLGPDFGSVDLISTFGIESRLHRSDCSFNTTLACTLLELVDLE